MKNKHVCIFVYADPPKSDVFAVLLCFITQGITNGESLFLQQENITLIIYLSPLYRSSNSEKH